MEIARLIKMHKDLCIQMGAASEQASKEHEYYLLRGKVELLDDLIAEELNGVKSIKIDCSQFDNERITYKLYDTFGVQLQCEFPSFTLSFEQASRVAFNWMEEVNIAEATIAMYRNGTLKAKKALIVHK